MSIKALMTMWLKVSINARSLGHNFSIITNWGKLWRVKNDEEEERNVHVIKLWSKCQRISGPSLAKWLFQPFSFNWQNFVINRDRLVPVHASAHQMLCRLSFHAYLSFFISICFPLTA